MESAHYTSSGLVRYRRCVCGNRWVEVAEFAPDEPAGGRQPLIERIVG
ncbi:hypothetical protein ACFHW2_25085 [Actinomadura sp. LOL_016]